MDREISSVGRPDAVLAAFHGMPAAAFVLEGPDLVVAAVNGAFAEFLGGRPAIGVPLAQAVPEAEQQGLVELAEDVYDSGEPFEGRAWRVQLERPGAGLVERYLDLRLSPWHGEDGQVRGVVAVAADVTAQVLARRAAERQRNQGRRYVQLHDLTLTLQDALLPEGLPVLPGLQTAGSYLLAEDEIAAGGDWLDVLPLGRGHVAFVVGDVVGHGVEASAVMGQLRAICEERLTSGAGVTGAMAALDRYAARQNGARSATITLMDLDTATGELTYCTAGHPPPLVLHEYESRFLAPTGGGPLGTGSSFPVATNRLGDKEVLLLYTDGIIERPYRQPARATVELAQVAGRALRGEIFDDEQPAVDRICRQTVELLTRESGYTDDITMLAVQRRPRLPALTFELEAVPSVLGEVRARLNAWFSLLDPSPLDQMAIQHAVGELVTNVVEHAYPEDARYRPVCVSLELDEQGMAVAKVEDHGRWRSDSGSQGHRGLPMVNGLMDEVSVERRGDQTTVIVRHRLTRGITLLKGVSTSAPDVALPAYATAYDDDNVLSVAGVVDLASAEHLRRDLNALTTAGHDQATVDLSQVELLASAGVQVLFEARGQAARQGVDVQFRATRGSVAQHVLELVNLPVVTHGGDPGWADELPPL